MTDGNPGDTSGAQHFPRLAAETQRFTLGRPRSVAVGNGRAAFLRSPGGRDPNTCLWVLDDAGERLVADPRALSDTDVDLPAEERARRERVRETASGITSYAVDRALTVAAFALAGQLGVTPLDGTGPARMLPSTGPVADPRPSPDGRLVGYVTAGVLTLADLDGQVVTTVAGPAGTTCGLPDFIASEELDRYRGWWWSPDSAAVIATVVDDAPVNTWWISDPSHPDRPAVEQRYPAAGTPNAELSLLLAGVAAPARQVTGWDTTAFPYLLSVRWGADGPPLLAVASRDQRTHVVLSVDVATAVATEVRIDHSETFLDVIVGVPDWLPDGRLLHTIEDAMADVRQLAVDGSAVSPLGLHIEAVRGVDALGRVVVVGAESDPTSRNVYAIEVSEPNVGAVALLSETPAVCDVVVGDDALALVTARFDVPGSRVEIRRASTVTVLESFAEPVPFSPTVRFLRAGDRRLAIGIVLPRHHTPGTKLPVLMDPYGGPHHSEVLAAHNIWLEPQWIADQGFAVVVVDGRGTPGRSLSWEKSITGDLASPPLVDQVDGLAAAAAQEPDLDLTRVAIRGWSFGGYLAALAVLRRPDVFHAAIAGAPVTTWRLYDTAYSERYLGVDPNGEDRGNYDASSLLGDAAALTRPLFIIHGLADDNVVAAHSLRLSSLLLAHGLPHDVLPLTGVTHVAGAAEVAENLLRLQIAWLRRALPAPTGAS